MRSLTSLFVDLCLVLTATLAAVVIRDNFEIGTERLISLVPYLLITLGIAGACLPTAGISRSLWLFSSMRDYFRIVAATILIVASAVAVGFLVNRLDGVARALPILQAILIISFLVGARVVARALHARRIRPTPAAPHGADIVLLVGITKLTELYLLCLAELDSSPVRVAGLLDDGGRIGLSIHSHPVLGTPEQVASTLRFLEVRGVFVDRIVVTTPRNRLSPAAQQALDDVQKMMTIRLEYLVERMGLKPEAADIAAAPGAKAAGGAADGIIAPGTAQIPYHRVKRAIDFVVAALLLTLLAPLILLVSLLVALDIGVPVLFWQERPGLGGRPFRLYKFRTMGEAHDTEGRRIADSERVSAIGNFLRRSRFDELPQIFNILKGDMSFVGPRPLLPVDQPADSQARLLVRPGLTGWAQIKGGRQISATDKVALDLWYVRNMSFALDLEIILGTVPMVLFGDRITERAIDEAWRDLEIGESAGFNSPGE